MAFWGIDTSGQLPVRLPHVSSFPLGTFPFSNGIPIRPPSQGKASMRCWPM